MDLHGQIMNLPARLPPDCAKMATATAYKAGHRDARHAAAELASAHEEELAALRGDAERYRKLRTAALRSIIGPVPTLAGYVNGKYTGEHRALLGGELDELVDAMQAVGAA